MKSIRSKLIISFEIFIIIATVLVGFISLKTADATMEKQAKKSVQLLAAEGAKLTKSRMEAIINPS